MYQKLILIFWVLLLVTFSYASAQDNDLTSVLFLMDQAKAALDENDLSTAQSFLRSAKILISSSTEACDTLLPASALLDTAIESGDTSLVQTLLEDARILIESCTVGHASTVTPTTTPTPPLPPVEPVSNVEIPDVAASSSTTWSPVIMTIGGVDMAVVPAGVFEMGSNDVDASVNEMPHTITFEDAFLIDVYEVTNAEYIVFLNAQNNLSYLDVEDTNARIFRIESQWQVTSGFEDHPVTEVTWFGANAYCAWRGARLPTESEWEYAASGPSNLLYPWGNQWEPENAVWSGNNPNTRTAVVGSRLQGTSWIGTYDMAGNVWEWVSSLYKPYPYNSSLTESSSNTSDNRVIRGGSSFVGPEFLRTSTRVWSRPGVSLEHVGFRCVRSE